MSRANRGFELSDEDLFAGAFAEDAVYELTGKGPRYEDELVKRGGKWFIVKRVRSE